MSKRLWETVKTGSTFELECLYKQDGTPVDLTALTIESQVRSRRGALLAELAVTKANQGTDPGVFTLSCGDSVTAAWPDGDNAMDIRITDASKTYYSETLAVRTVKGITEEVEV